MATDANTEEAFQLRFLRRTYIAGYALSKFYGTELPLEELYKYFERWRESTGSGMIVKEIAEKSQTR